MGKTMITPSFSLTATERVLPRLALDFTTELLDSYMIPAYIKYTDDMPQWMGGYAHGQT
jgi:hypothetical protein